MDFKPLPYDPELDQLLQQMPPTEEMKKLFTVALDQVLPADVAHEEHTFSGSDGNELTISIFRRKVPLSTSNGQKQAIYHIHGGGMIVGNRFSTIVWTLDMVEKLDVVGLSIEYRLATVQPDPAPVEDCYSGLLWTFEHADDLGIDPSQIIINGSSAGAGLAAGVTLLCRDRNGPKLLGQMLFAPMLDDRNDSLSSHQFEGRGLWDRQLNFVGWNCLLGERRGTENVSIYSAPARATDVSRLPIAYLDTSTGETFRDEDVQYANNLWKCGVPCELHVWAGAFHGSDLFCPTAAISISTANARLDWIKRLLHRQR